MYIEDSVMLRHILEWTLESTVESLKTNQDEPIIISSPQTFITPREIERRKKIEAINNTIQCKKTAAYQVQGTLHKKDFFSDSAEGITENILDYAFDNKTKYTNKQALEEVQPKLKIFSSVIAKRPQATGSINKPNKEPCTSMLMRYVGLK